MSHFHSNGKNLCFTPGCSHDLTSILRSGLMSGGRESKEGRQTIFFTLLNQFGDNPDEEGPSDDLLKQSRVHFRTPSTGSRQPELKKKGIAVLADKISRKNCLQFCAGRLHPQRDLSKCAMTLYEGLSTSRHSRK